MTVLGQAGGSYQITQSVIAGGGGPSDNGSLHVAGTSGQAAVGTSSSGAYTVRSGFWPAPAPSSPTAAPALISGSVTSTEGLPLAGVLMTLSGSSQATTITDSDGVYSFTNAEVGGFYAVTPSRANYTFTPASRSFSLLGNRLDAVFTGSADAAARASIGGRVTASDGLPLAGVVLTLGGVGQARTITDSDGMYSFANAAVGSFYTVTAARANYTFSPANQSFLLIANRTDAVFTAIADAVPTANPLDTPEFFVRQQYLDLLNREPDQDGFNYWSAQILACGSDALCLNARRRDVAAAFFIEREFQESGSFIYELYEGALGRRPDFAEYKTDRQQVVGGADLETKKTEFAQAFVQRSELVQKYQSNTSAESFVGALIQNVQQSPGVDLSDRFASLISAYNSGGSLIESRAAVIRAVADDAAFKQSQYNAAFVLTEYFVYLRRNPDQEGYDFWLNVLNNGDQGNYRGMVCSFITAAEYQLRFSPVVTRSNRECGR